MRAYYYLVASLPMLSFHMGAPPLSHREFLDSCRRLVVPKDFETVKSAEVGRADPIPSVHGFLDAWQRAELGVRNELVRARARRRGSAPEPYFRTEFIDPIWSERIREVVEEPSPLRAELHYLRLLWGIIDDLESGHPFDTAFLISYSLRLQILERKSQFDVHKGRERLKALISGDSHEF